MIRAACVVVTVFAVGCGAADSGPALRPSASLLIDVGETKAGGIIFNSAEVSDVALDQSRVVVTVNFAPSGSVPVVVVSEDTGKTWARHDFPVPSFFTGSDSVTDFGVQAAGGQVSLVARRSRSGAGGGSYPYRLVMDADLSTDRFTSGEQDTNRQLWTELHQAGPSILAWGFEADPRTVGATVQQGTLKSADYRVDLRTLTTRDTSHSFNVGNACVPGLQSWATTDGVTFIGYCLTPQDLCRVTANPASGIAPGSRCLARTQWPTSLQNPLRVVATPRGVRWLHEGQGHVWAAGLDAQDAVDVVDLGAGTLATQSRLLAPRYGGLIAIDSAPGVLARLLALTATGVDELTLPATPCVEGAKTCGANAHISALLPLGGDSFLVFYVVDTLGGSKQTGSHPSLYASREQATRKPFVP